MNQIELKFLDDVGSVVGSKVNFPSWSIDPNDKLVVEEVIPTASVSAAVSLHGLLKAKELKLETL